MRKGFNYTLNKRLRQLSTYAPDEKQWESIEQVLDLDAEITDKLSHLPVYEPNPHSWKAISNRISTSKNPISLYRLGQIAAASVIVFALSFAWISKRNRGLLIETEKVDKEAILNIETGKGENDPINTIKALCKSGAPVCKTDGFVEKLALYSELSEELKQLEIVIDQVGESPEMIHSIIKIENLKSNTLQELILLIHS